MAYTVGEVARLAHVSVRTLHHYDELGLFEPSARSEAGYRLYSDNDLARLQQVLLYRELGFTLEEIAQVLSDPEFEPLDALINQRMLVADRLMRDGALLALLDKMIATRQGGFQMTKEEMFEIFGDFDPAEHEQEARERWGDTDAYRESARRTRGYTKADWERFKTESDTNGTAMIELFDADIAPGDPRAMDVAEDARLLIDRWFYPCSKEMHLALGRNYLVDPRFKAHYEKMREGLTEWLVAAITANAARPQGHLKRTTS